MENGKEKKKRLEWRAFVDYYVGGEVGVMCEWYVIFKKNYYTLTRYNYFVKIFF